MEYRNFIKLVGLLLLFAVLLTAVYSSKRRIEASIDDAFKYAIEQDYQNRKDYVRGLTRQYSRFFRNNPIHPVVERKIGSYSFRTSDGITTYTFADSVPEEVAKRLLNQHLMDQLCKLNPNHVKKKFQGYLKNKDVQASVGVLCLRDTACYWSEADSIVPKNAYSTPRHTLDLTGTLKVQAWADYGWGEVLAHLDPVTYLMLLLLIGIGVWVWPASKSPKQEIEAEELEKESNKGIWIDSEKQELYVDGVLCTIRRLDLALLQMLYEQQGECVTREEIKQRFWPTDNNAGEKIDSHIKNIRKILKDFPRYQVTTVRGKGYYLSEV